MSDDPAEAHVSKLWDEMCEARKQAERTGAPKDWLTAGMLTERFTQAFTHMPIRTKGSNVIKLEARRR